MSLSDPCVADREYLREKFAEGSKIRSIPETFGNLLDQLKDADMADGVVVKVRSDRVYIDRGSNSGEGSFLLEMQDKRALPPDSYATAG